MVVRDAKTARRIVVLGAGYAGLTAAQTLGKALRRRPEYEVILVDRRDTHELKPKLPEAVGEWTDCSVQVPLQEVLKTGQVTLFQTEVTGLDPVEHVVFTEAGPLPYWRLVVALGAQPDFAPGGRVIPGLTDVAIAPYTQGAACHLRHHLAQVVEEASLQQTAPEREALLTVVVAGAGFVGVEMAAQLADRLRELKSHFELPADTGRVILVDPRSAPLGFSPDLNGAVLQSLLEQGVDVRLGVGLAEAWPDRVGLTDGTFIQTRTLVWTAGVRGSALAPALRLPTDDKARILVDSALRVIGPPSIYAIGDAAQCASLDARPELANSAQSAVAQGQFVAQAILAEVRRKPLPNYTPHSRGVVVLLGHHQAVARVGPLAPIRRGARWLKQLPTLHHLWRLGGAPLTARHWSSTLQPLVSSRRSE